MYKTNTTEGYNQTGQSPVRNKTGEIRIWLAPSQHLVRRRISGPRDEYSEDLPEKCLREKSRHVFSNTVFKVLLVFALLGGAVYFMRPSRELHGAHLDEDSSAHESGGNISLDYIEEERIPEDDNQGIISTKVRYQYEGSRWGKQDGFEISLASIVQAVVRLANHDIFVPSEKWASISKEQQLFDGVVKIVLLGLEHSGFRVRSWEAIPWANLIKKAKESFYIGDLQCRKRLVCELMQDPDLYHVKKAKDFLLKFGVMPDEQRLGKQIDEYLEYADLSQRSSCEKFYCGFSIKDIWAESIIKVDEDDNEDSDEFDRHFNQTMQLMPVMYVSHLLQLTEMDFKLDLSRDFLRPFFFVKMFWHEVDPEGYLSTGNAFLSSGWLVEKVYDNFGFGDARCYKRLICEVTKDYLDDSNKLRSYVNYAKMASNFFDLPGELSEIFDSFSSSSKNNCVAHECSFSVRETFIEIEKEYGAASVDIITSFVGKIFDNLLQRMLPDVSGKDVFKDGHVVQWMGVLHDMYMEFDYKDIRCRKRLFKEVMEKPERYGYVAVWAKNAMGYSGYLFLLGLPHSWINLWDEYVNTYRSVDGWNECTYSIEESIKRHF